MYKKTKLDNGLKIITHSMPGMQSAALGIWIKIGGRYESDKIKGVSHFIEHLLFKGSRKYSCRKLKESIEGVGGSLNGFTSEELTCYLVKIPAAHLYLALDILSDMVINPLLLEADVEKERTVILEEYKMYRDLPQSYVHELLDELLWPSQALGQSIIGTLESLTSMKGRDLADFKQQHYTPSNIVVSAAGALKHEEFAKKVERIFSSSLGGGANKFSSVTESQDKPQLNIFAKETEQTHLAMGFHALRRGHPLKHALGLLNIIMGANMSSRLFNEVRENRGLAYEIGTQVKRFSDTGAFVVHAGIDNQKVEAAVSVILEELGRSKQKLVSLDEFRRAKDFYLGQLMLALEDTLDNMLWIGETMATLDTTYTLADIIKEVKKVTREDIKEVAQSIFTSAHLNLALIGPIKDKEDRLRAKLNIN